MSPVSSTRASALLASALGGLLGACETVATSTTDAAPPRCEPTLPTDASTTDASTTDASATDASATDANTTDARDGGPVVTTRPTDASFTFRRFLEDCARRGGFVQTHATCAGVNACRGVSYNRFDRTLSEHSCRGLNGCGGMSCVEAAADQNRQAEPLYAADCAGCHGEDQFTLFLEPGVSAPVGTARFNDPTRRTQQGALIAFGIQGHGRGPAQPANMPGRWERYSRAEILRLVEYIHTIPLRTSEMVILGETHEVNPDGGDPIPLDASVPPG